MSYKIKKYIYQQTSPNNKLDCDSDPVKTKPGTNSGNEVQLYKQSRTSVTTI